jgi:hypothetical protein
MARFTFFRVVVLLLGVELVYLLSSVVLNAKTQGIPSITRYFSEDNTELAKAQTPWHSSKWTLDGALMALDPLGEQIKLHPYLQRHAHTSQEQRAQAPRVAIVTLYAGGARNLVSITGPIKKAYADRHGYTFCDVYLEDEETKAFVDGEGSENIMWIKFWIVRRWLVDKDFDWVMW